MLVIPNLCCTPFQKIVVSLSVARGEFSMSGYAPSEEIDEEDFDNRGEYALKAHLQGDPPVYATVEIGHLSDDECAWLELSFEKPPAKPELAQHPDPELTFTLDKWKDVDAESIWHPLNVYIGKKVDLFVSASFTVKRDELPAESLVASMIGLRTSAGEEQFLLSGAQFAVRGFPDDTISWYLKPGTHGQEVSGQLVRQCVEQFHWESISDAVHVIEARFNRVVRAQSNIRAHATS